MADDALVIFTPSGKRGRVPVGTPVLTAARKLGVDLDSLLALARGQRPPEPTKRNSP